MGSQIVGNLISAYVLGSLSEVSYMLIMLAIAFIACITFIFLRAPNVFKKPVSLKFVEDIMERQSVHSSIRAS